MAGRRLIGWFGFILLAVGLAGATFAPGDVQAQQACCQCPLPTCGPPNAGKCGTGCTLVPNARCDGHTGRCQGASAMQSTLKDPKFAGLTAPGLHTASTKAVAIGGSR